MITKSSVRVTPDVYDALEAIGWEEHIRTKNDVIRFLLHVAGAEGFEDDFEEED